MLESENKTFGILVYKSTANYFIAHWMPLAKHYEKDIYMISEVVGECVVQYY